MGNQEYSGNGCIRIPVVSEPARPSVDVPISTDNGIYSQLRSGIKRCFWKARALNADKKLYKVLVDGVKSLDQEFRDLGISAEKQREYLKEALIDRFYPRS